MLIALPLLSKKYKNHCIYNKEDLLFLHSLNYKFKIYKKYKFTSYKYTSKSVEKSLI